MKMKLPGISGGRRTVAIIVILAIAVLGIIAAAFFYFSTQYSLALKGDREMTVGLYSVYEDPGVRALRGGADASGDVSVTGKVDTSRPGRYDLEYRLGHLTVDRTVIVDDKMDPELILNEDNGQTEAKLGEEYVDPGYIAVDGDGNDITDRVKVKGEDFKRSGKNEVTYTVSDDSGKTTKVTRQVNVEPNTDYPSVGLPICMYHYVYDEEDPPEDLYQRYGNYISAQDLEEELTWLNEEGYYYPTWEEVRDFIDGKLILPEKSIVLCFDDGAKSFLENGIPVLEKCKVPATCFMITSSNGREKVRKYRSRYVTYESHSNDMHRAGGYIGHGGIFTAMPEEEALADLKMSIKICGSGDAFAYPYGDYTEECRNIVEKAGFLCAVTTQYGKSYPGYDPMLLPRVRMTMGQSLESFQGMVSP